MGYSPRKIGLGGVSAAGDRLGYPAISMNFKTESFTYVILLINKQPLKFSEDPCSRLLTHTHTERERERERERLTSGP